MKILRLVVRLYDRVAPFLPEAPTPVVLSMFCSEFCFYGHKITLICCLFSRFIIIWFSLRLLYKNFIFINTFPVFPLKLPF